MPKWIADFRGADFDLILVGMICANAMSKDPGPEGPALV